MQAKETGDPFAQGFGFFVLELDFAALLGAGVAEKLEGFAVFEFQGAVVRLAAAGAGKGASFLIPVRDVLQRFVAEIALFEAGQKSQQMGELYKRGFGQKGVWIGV